LTKDEGEALPGRLSCKNRGYLEKLMNGENLISKMHQYFEFLAKSSKNSEGLWTSPYIDAWGLGLLVTHAVPAITKSGKYVIRPFFNKLVYETVDVRNTDFREKK
jgi:hypothetical protein